jgi:hypothetical protein
MEHISRKNIQQAYERIWKSRIFCTKPVLSLSAQIYNPSHFSQFFTLLISDHVSTKNKPMPLKELILG